MIFREVFGRKQKTQTEVVTPRMLPSDVRYALQYREAKLGLSEIRDLVRNGFEKEGVYLLLKATSENPGLQKEILQAVVTHIVEADEKAVPATIWTSLVEKYFPQIDQNIKVSAQKLAQLSRQGFDSWHKRYEELAVAEASKANATYIVGHSTFVGLDAFVKNFKGHTKELRVLIPEFFDKETLDMCGYTIGADGKVLFLKKDFTRDPQSIIIDDVKHTGAAEKKVLEFWVGEENHPSPQPMVFLDQSTDQTK